MQTQTEVNESVEQLPALSDFLKSLQGLRQRVAQIRTDGGRRRAQDAEMSDFLRSLQVLTQRVTQIPTEDARRRAQDAALAKLPKLDEICDLYVWQVLDLCGGHRVRAAQTLGVGKTSIYRYIRRGNFQNKSRLSVLARPK